MAQQGGVPAQRKPVVATQTLQEAPNATPSAPPPQHEETVILVLRPRKKVSWTVETVDNEHMQKKSSKICCVFHKKEALEYICDDEGDDCGCEGRRKGLCHHHSDDDDDRHEGEGMGAWLKPSSHDVAESSEKSKE